MKESGGLGHGSADRTTLTRRGRQRSTSVSSLIFTHAKHHVLHLGRNQTLPAMSTVYSRGRGARCAPHSNLRATHMGRGTKKSNAAFCGHNPTGWLRSRAQLTERQEATRGDEGLPMFGNFCLCIFFSVFELGRIARTFDMTHDIGLERAPDRPPPH